MTSKACDSFTRSQKSAIEPVRLPRRRSLTLGGPATGAKITWRPPTRQVRCGLRATRLVSAGTLASAWFTRPGSSRTSWLDSSTAAPAAASAARPRGESTRIPWRSRSPSAASCRLSISSAENRRTGSNGLTRLR